MTGVSGTTYAIHPALGIARMGNAVADPIDPSTYYLGGESLYEVPNQGQPYKTGGRLKKQAQRFRIYEYADGQATREITLQTPGIASIQWTVRLANRKAALNTDQPTGSISLPAVVPPECYGLNDATSPDPHYYPAKTRNPQVAVADRAQLCIDSGAQSVGGTITQVNLSGTIAMFDETGSNPVSKAVAMGTLYAEPGTGRLLVFGGNGISEGLLNGQFTPLRKLTDWGNNNAWYDDSADGPVQATITFADGTTVTLDQPGQQAWVISAAPRYAPAMNWFTTLYDVAVNAVQPTTTVVAQPSFANDIFPILRCVSLLQWLSIRASAGHGTGRGGYYLDAARMQLVSDNNSSPNSDPYLARNGVFSRIRNPNQDVDRATVQRFMPQVSHDITSEPSEDFDITAVTPLQFAKLQAWRDGNFSADGVPEFVPLEQVAISQQPTMLDRAALEGTAGTPFYPGIESWRIMRPAGIYASGMPLRMARSTQPGDLTIGNALPWQADFLDCNDIWWPVQRPNEVTRDGQPAQLWVPNEWIPTEDTADYNKMVLGWWQLGFVVTNDDGATYVEVEGTAGDPIA